MLVELTSIILDNAQHKEVVAVADALMKEGAAIANQNKDEISRDTL